jgi:hypothetical protein
MIMGRLRSYGAAFNQGSIRARFNLASTLLDLGDLRRAKAEFRAYSAACHRTLGADHPLTRANDAHFSAVAVALSRAPGKLPELADLYAAFIHVDLLSGPR